jgi:hypothetical protein
MSGDGEDGANADADAPIFCNAANGDPLLLDELLASFLCKHTGDGRWAKIHADYHSASGEEKSIGWLKKRAAKIKKLVDEVPSAPLDTPAAVCIECGLPSTNHCKQCKEPYCTRECQIGAWPMHKFTCSGKVKIAESAGQGMGVFSRRAFEVGDELSREAPLVVLGNKTQSFSQAHAYAIGEDEATFMIMQLPEAKRKIALDFTDVHAEVPNRPTCGGIARTNSIPMGSSCEGSPSETGGLFPIACRLNHSCRPNARYIWDPAHGRELVIAMRPRAVGEAR